MEGQDKANYSYDQPPQYNQPSGYTAQPGWAPPAVMTQPTHTTNTTIVINQPATPTLLTPRTWSSDLCSMCDDVEVCLCVTFLGPCAGCKLAMDMGESCCLPYCVPGWLIVLRTKLRTQHNIQGSVMDDCGTICMCGPCVHCQMMREVKMMKNLTPAA